KAIAAEKSGAPPAPPPREPAGRAPEPEPAPLPATNLNVPPPQAEKTATLVEQPAPATAADESRPSLVSRPWFWIAIGAVVGGGTAAILLATRKDTYPDPTLGKL